MTGPSARCRQPALILVVCGVAVVTAASAGAQVGTPVIKWSRGGCYSSWCETGWYSSPAVADIDSDGDVEVIASAYSVVVLDGNTGAIQWRASSGHDVDEPGATNVGRTWPGIVVADVDGDQALEIVTAHGGGWVGVYRSNGRFESGWPQRPATKELRGLSVADLDNDGTMEIVVTGAVTSRINAWVLEHTGALRPGWPQLAGDDGSAWGVFNDTSAIADLDRDGTLEVLIPSDVHYICAYEPNGSHIPADPVFGTKLWGEVGVWESYAIELRGWGKCNGERAESYRTNFANGPATVADLDGDGIVEIVATGRVYDCTGGETTKYNGIYVFEADRGRFDNGTYDWTIVPTDLGLPLSLSYEVIENATPNPVVADLDSDGEMEMLYSDFAGQVHAFRLDGNEVPGWPYQVYDSGEGFFRYAGEPLVADLDNNGSPEVIFASWTQKTSGASGKLHILNASGLALHEVTLPDPVGSWTWNGAMAAPTLANIDDDAEYEVVVNTAHSGVVTYDLPGTANARLVWPTGRGSYTRDGYREPEVLFIDGFESGNTSRWSVTVPP